MYTIYLAECLLLMSIGGQATWRFKTGFPIIPRSHNSVRRIAVARLGTTTDSLSYTYSYIHTCIHTYSLYIRKVEDSQFKKKRNIPLSSSWTTRLFDPLLRGWPVFEKIIWRYVSSKDRKTKLVEGCVFIKLYSGNNNYANNILIHFNLAEALRIVVVVVVVVGVVVVVVVAVAVVVVAYAVHTYHFSHVVEGSSASAARGRLEWDGMWVQSHVVSRQPAAARSGPFLTSLIMQF